jgi:SAM-dependent methyltransferase
MVQTEKDREHKKRQQKRNREQRQESLEELLERIPPISDSLLGHSCRTVEDAYQSIPTLDVEFWKHVPVMCNPMTATMDSSLTGLDKWKRARDERFQVKRRRKLEAREQRGEITKEEQETLWKEHGRKNMDSEAASSLLSAHRGQRKAWQVENFVTLLKDRLRPGMTVVDFGCGSGNLCLALAAYFSKVRFVLVDRNEFSLQLVQKRAETSKLSNVHTQQFTFSPGNLKDYRPPPHDALDKKETAFDLGIGLHCCGSFTDMVMEVCLYQGADCIVCPCCNGGMTAKATGGFSYPRSDFLQQCMTQDEYLSRLSRNADNAQNYAAKCWIEYDRALWAKEHGKCVELWKMEPVTCTPKHHVLFVKNDASTSTSLV